MGWGGTWDPTGPKTAFPLMPGAAGHNTTSLKEMATTRPPSPQDICANCCVTNIIVSFAPPWCWITFTVISIALFTLYLALLSSLLPANANAVQPQIFEQPLKFERKRCQEKPEPRHTTRHHKLKPACRSEAPEQACVGYYATNSKAFPVLSPTTLYTQLLLPPRPFNEHLLAGCV